MRPERLELTGFTAYREPTVVDFSMAELFALVGPTGSGKTALIDAICFSLYGSIPRLDDRRKVEPVISLGKQEARVRFDFTVGEQTYTAVRVVRRTKSGATTAEARLSLGDVVIAGNADEVSAEVERLLGLNFEHFTKCVVLPQGEFAAFLHDKPASRQLLLWRLLDLGVYDRLRELARKRREGHEVRTAALSRQLEDVAEATPQALQAAQSRHQQLGELRLWLAREEPKLEALRQASLEATATASQNRKQAQLLEQLRVPAGLTELAARVHTADDGLALAEAEVERATTEAGWADAVRKSLPSPIDLRRWVDERQRLTTEMADRDQARLELAAAQAAEVEAREALEINRSRLIELRNLHAAHQLSLHLVEGEPCPVCHRPVVGAPKVSARPRALSQQEELVTSSEARLEKAASETAALAQRCKDLDGRIVSLQAALVDAPGGDDLAVLVESVAQHHAAWEKAQKTVEETRNALDRARKKRETVAKEIETVRLGFYQAREKLAVLEPPPAEGENIINDWGLLQEWAGEEGRRLSAAAGEAEAEAVEIEQQLSQATARLLDQLKANGVDGAGGSWNERVVEELTTAAVRVSRLGDMLDKAEKARREIDEQKHLAEVAKVLAQYLRADGFVAWLLEEALDGLLEAANHLLADLSAGGYSLERQKQDLWVIDHRNADQRRPVKTLSGGETFLVSLSLALAMAEGLATLSGRGSARLESIFLDEGFGSLDGETLEVVADVIQELGAQGRTVGVVTHVAELADRVPVRFEVRPGPKGATVERIEQ